MPTMMGGGVPADAQPLQPTAGSGAFTPTSFLRPQSGIVTGFPRHFSVRNEEVHVSDPGAAPLGCSAWVAEPAYPAHSYSP